MLKLAIRNLTENALDNLAGEKLFADTDKGKFVLRTASYGDELAYLIIELHKNGKLTWSKDKKGRYVTKYKGLKIEVVSDGTKESLVVVLDKNQYVFSKSLLVDALAHTILHTLDTPHFHLVNEIVRKMQRNFYDKQKKVAEKAIDILKSK